MYYNYVGPKKQVTADLGGDMQARFWYKDKTLDIFDSHELLDMSLEQAKALRNFLNKIFNESGED